MTNSIFKFLTIILISLMFLACKNDFKAIEVEISRLPNDEIVNTEQVKYLAYENEKNERPVYKKNVNIMERHMEQLEESNKRWKFVEKYIEQNSHSGDDYLVLSSRASAEYDRRAKVDFDKLFLDLEEYYKTEKGKEEQKKFIKALEEQSRKREESEQRFLTNIKSQNLTCINSQFKIQNNVSENIENLFITTIIEFNFSNRSFYYVRSKSPLLNSELLKSNSSLKFELNDIAGLANGYNDQTFLNHTANKITISYYLSASNSVGYSNSENINNIKGSVLGDFIDSEKIEADKYGQKIYKKDITQLFYE